MQAREVCDVHTQLLLTLKHVLVNHLVLHTQLRLPLKQLVLLVEYQVQLVLQLTHLLLNVCWAERS